MRFKDSLVKVPRCYLLYSPGVCTAQAGSCWSLVCGFLGHDFKGMDDNFSNLLMHTNGEDKL